MRYWCSARLVACGLVVLLARGGGAATGSLDPDFGSGGKVTTATNGRGEINALVVLPNTSILAAGANGDDFGVALYSAGGVIQTSYGGAGTGIAAENIGPPGAAQAAALRADGYLWTAGGATGFAVALFGPNGSNGHARVTQNTYWGYGLALLPDNGALVVGEAGNGRGTCALAAVDAFGAPISGFGNQGVTISAVGRCEGVVRLSDGSVVVTANEDAAGTNGFGIARFTALGALDGTFGTGGVTLAFQDTSAFVHALARQSDGKYVVVGQAGSGLSTPKSMVIVRFTAEGQLDSDFGDHGVIAIGLPNTPIGLTARAVVIDGSGNIIVGGTATAPSNVKDGAGPGAFLIFRLLPNGQPDLSFGDDNAGAIFTGFGTGSDAELNALALQSDGKLLAGGQSCLNSQCGFAMARYILGAPVAVTTTTVPGNGGTTTTTLPSTGCEGQGGLLGLRCLCGQGVERAACAGQTPRAQIGGLFGKACASVEKAAAAGKVALARRAYTKTRGLLKKVSALTKHQAKAKRKNITPACAAALEASFSSGRTLVDGVLAGLKR